MKKFLALLFPLLLLTGCAGEPKNIGYMQISTQRAIEIMEEETDYIILDVRTPEEFNSGHIKNAVNVPNESIQNDNIAVLPRKSQLILVYCRSGNRSKQAAQKLAYLGYNNIKEFGGINSWTGEIVTEADAN